MMFISRVVLLFNIRFVSIAYKQTTVVYIQTTHEASLAWPDNLDWRLQPSQGAMYNLRTGPTDPYKMVATLNGMHFIHPDS